MLTAMVHSWTRCVLLTSVVECGHWMTSLELADGLETSRRSVATAKDRNIGGKRIDYFRSENSIFQEDVID